MYFKCELSADSVQDPVVNGAPFGGGGAFLFFLVCKPKNILPAFLSFAKKLYFTKNKEGGPPLDLPLRQATILLTTGHKVQPFIVQLACIRYN